MGNAVQVDMPFLPRESVAQEVRDDWNRLLQDSRRLEGIVPVILGAGYLGVSRQHLYTLMDNGAIRFCTHDGHRYVSLADIVQRKKDIKAGLILRHRPRK
jgi:hypothetical protein